MRFAYFRDEGLVDEFKAWASSTSTSSQIEIKSTIIYRQSIERSCHSVTSVTRFGKNLPLAKFKTGFGNLLRVYLLFGKN